MEPVWKFGTVSVWRSAFHDMSDDRAFELEVQLDVLPVDGKIYIREDTQLTK
jgi:hypothetical protein